MPGSLLAARCAALMICALLKLARTTVSARLDVLSMRPNGIGMQVAARLLVLKFWSGLVAGM